MAFTEWNLTWFRAVNNIGKEYEFLNPVFIFFADYMVYLLAISLLVIWFSRTYQNRMMVIHASLAFVFAEVVGKIAGLFYSNNQPFAELAHVNKLIVKAVNNSFPSDHTILFFSFCFSFWLVRKKTGTLWMLIALCVGISRIGVGVHYPFDIIGGAAIGMLSAFAAYLLVPRIRLIRKWLAIYEKVEQMVLPIKGQSKNI